MSCYCSLWSSSLYSQSVMQPLHGLRPNLIIRFICNSLYFSQEWRTLDHYNVCCYGILFSLLNAMMNIKIIYFLDIIFRYYVMFIKSKIPNPLFKKTRWNMNTEKFLERYSPLKIQCKSFQEVIERYFLVQETGLFSMYAITLAS